MRTPRICIYLYTCMYTHSGWGLGRRVEQGNRTEFDLQGRLVGRCARQQLRLDGHALAAGRGGQESEEQPGGPRLCRKGVEFGVHLGDEAGDHLVRRWRACGWCLESECPSPSADMRCYVHGKGLWRYELTQKHVDRGSWSSSLEMWAGWRGYRESVLRASQHDRLPPAGRAHSACMRRENSRRAGGQAVACPGMLGAWRLGRATPT